MDLVYREGRLNFVAYAISCLIMVNHFPVTDSIYTHPAVSLLNLTFTQQHNMPVAVIPVVGGMVCVRSQYEPWLRQQLKKTVLTNSDRYGIIVKIYRNKQLRVRFANGTTKQTSVNRLQHIPLPRRVDGWTMTFYVMFKLRKHQIQRFVI
jgi:hypothetical protein